MRKISTHLVIADHRLPFDHEFNWEDEQILDKEMNYYKRLRSEKYYISDHKKERNLQTDTEFLEHAYTSIFNNFQENCL